MSLAAALLGVLANVVAAEKDELVARTRHPVWVTLFARSVRSAVVRIGV